MSELLSINIEDPEGNEEKTNEIAIFFREQMIALKEQ